MAEENCAHRNCHCKITDGAGVSKDGKTYCSEVCANSAAGSGGDCRCGHPDCK